MTAKFQPYSDIDNLNTIHAVSREIILSVAPNEEIGAEELIDDLVEDYENGQITAADTGAETSGGFGEIDLITLLVVPLVVAVLTKFFEKLIDSGFERLKPKLPEKIKADPTEQIELAGWIDLLVEEQYVVISKQVKSKKSGAKEKTIKQTTKMVVKRKLGLHE